MTGPNKAANCERYIFYQMIFLSNAFFRVIATLKGRIYRFLTHNKTKNYVDVLDKIVSAINATKHSSTKYRPDEIGYDNQVRKKCAIIKLRQIFIGFCFRKFIWRLVQSCG